MHSVRANSIKAEVSIPGVFEWLAKFKEIDSHRTKKSTPLDNVYGLSREKSASRTTCTIEGTALLASGVGGVPQGVMRLNCFTDFYWSSL
jgi:hypothetical protein